jgi:hypothetical protein
VGPGLVSLFHSLVLIDVCVCLGIEGLGMLFLKF